MHPKTASSWNRVRRLGLVKLSSHATPGSAVRRARAVHVYAGQLCWTPMGARAGGTKPRHDQPAPLTQLRCICGVRVLVPLPGNPGLGTKLITELRAVPLRDSLAFFAHGRMRVVAARSTRHECICMYAYIVKKLYSRETTSDTSLYSQPSKCVITRGHGKWKVKTSPDFSL